MTKLTLYYPGFAQPDGEPESIEFNEINDLKKDNAIKDRMFGIFGLRKTYAYATLKPEFNRHTDKYYITVFHKHDGGYYGAATIIGDTDKEVTDALTKLGTKSVPADKW